MQQTLPFDAIIGRSNEPIDRATVDTGAIRTSYVSSGHGRPVIFIHGAGAGAVAWSSIIAGLSNAFWVIAPDVVGYGESDKPSAKYDRRFFTSWLCQFLDSLGVEKCSMVGHSQGGAIALEFALNHPARVDQLVLVCPAGIKPVLPLKLLFFAAWLYTWPSPKASQQLHSLLIHNYRCNDAALINYAAEVCQKPGGTRVFWEGHGKALLPIPRERLRHIPHQTLVVWGADDRIFPPTHGMFLQRIMTRARLRIIPNAGHIPFLDQPLAFNHLLVQFLAETSC